MKDFKNWIKNRSEIEKVGKVAVFYLPANKLGKIREELHAFLVDNYKAYTHEKGGIKGYWTGGSGLKEDRHERYEVSFDGDENFKKLVEFISKMCGKTNEESIYLTIADESYLVRPSKSS